MWPHDFDLFYHWYVTLPATIFILWHEAMGSYQEKRTVDNEVIPPQLWDLPNRAFDGTVIVGIGLGLWALFGWLYRLADGVPASARVALFYVFYGAVLLEPIWLLIRRRILWDRIFVSRRIATLRGDLGKVGHSDRLSACEELGRLGYRAHAAVPALLEHALWTGGGNLWDHVRSAASYALGQIGEANAVAALVSILEARLADRPMPIYPPDREIVENTLGALGMIGPRAAGAVPVLVRYLATPPPARLAERAIKVLGQIGPAARIATPLLKGMRQGVPSFMTSYSSKEIETIQYEADKALKSIDSPLPSSRP